MNKEILEEEKEGILRSEKERFVRWLVTECGVSHRTAECYGKRIIKVLRELNTMLPTKEQCREYRDNLLIAGKKSGYLLGIVKSVRHYGRFIGKDLKIKYPKRERQKLPTFLSETELKQMVFACQSIKEKLVIMLMGGCGLRINEVCRLKISNIDFDNATMIVPTVKTDSRWEIPISNGVLETMKAYLQYERPRNNGYETLLLDRCSKPYNAENCHGIRLIVHRIAKRAGIQKRVYPHMLRHSFASLLMKNGANLSYIQQLLRHEDIKSTLVYCHVMKNDLKEVYEKCNPLRLSLPMKDQVPFEPEQRLLSQNRLNREYEQPLSDFDKTKIADHRYGLKNGYS